MWILTRFSDPEMIDIPTLVKVHSVGYSLQDVKVNFHHDLKINVGDIQIEGQQGEILNLPRWVANVLSNDKLAEIQDSDMIVELKQAIVKENVQGEFDLSTLDTHFYIKLRSHMARLDKDDYDKVESMLNSLIRKRQGKIIRLADSSKLTADISQKLSIEERAFYTTIYNNSIEFKNQVLGVKK